MPATNKLKVTTRLGQFNSTAGRQSMNLDIGNPLTKLYLRLKYTHTSGGADAVGRLFQQNIRLLQKVEVIVQGRDTVWNITPALYAARCAYERAGVPLSGMETVITATAAAVTNVDVIVPLDFTLINGRKRDDAALDLRGIAIAQLAVTFGTVADLWTTPGAAAITNLVCSVEAEYLFNTKPGEGFITRSLDEMLYPITGSSNNFSFDVDGKTGVAVRSLPLFFLTGNIGDDALCPVGGANPGWVRLVSGSQQFINSEIGFVKARAQEEMRVPAGNAIAGLDYVDILFDGALATSIPTGQLDANLKYQANVTYAAGNSQVVCQREVTRPFRY